MSAASMKPRYIDPTGDPQRAALSVRPPFLMNGVSSRVFPLEANMARLAQFCDRYLNVDIPRSIVQFRPAAPYVYLMVLDYGSMSSASVAAQNVGWVAQHEVTFTVPLERWRERNGRMVFEGWACVSPFIFVDDQLSLTTGREVYGWPKVSGVVDADVPLWSSRAFAPARVFTFSTHVFPRVYAGEPESLRVLLEIEADAAPSYSSVPPYAANPWYPLPAAAQALRSALSLGGTALDMMLGLRVRGYRTQRDLDSLLAMAGKAAGGVKRLLPALWPALGRSSRAAPARLSFDNITVKQFRDAQAPERACYQALVSSPMGIERWNRSGLLGDLQLLRGDVSGGYSVRIHRYPSQPIIELLGLNVVGARDDGHGDSVAVLKPTFPFWTDVDLLYGGGRVICSRAHGPDATTHEWLDEQPIAAAPRRTVSPPEAPPKTVPLPEAPPKTAPLPEAPPKTVPLPEAPPHAAEAPESAQCAFNTALGAATQPIAGPFEFPDVTLQVYPLLADRTRLVECLDRTLNAALAGTGLRFEPFGSFAYLTVGVIGDQLGTMWSSVNNIGWWAEREVAFCVPVKWYRGDELLTVAMVAPFIYANSGRAVITDREVNGRPTIEADIQSPADVWLERSGPDDPRRLLRLDTETFPALHTGQQSQLATLLEIDERDVLPYNDDVGWRMIAQSWGKRLVDDLRSRAQALERDADAVHDVKALALELLAHGAPMNFVNLKQYRDATDVDRACYQAAVHTTRQITRIYDVREIEQRVHVHVHRLAGHPVVDALGLAVKSTDSDGAHVIDHLQPVRPFWMRVSTRESLATVIAWRATDDAWHVTHPWFAPDCAQRPYFVADGPTRVGTWLGQPGRLWQRLHDHAQAWLEQAIAAQQRANDGGPEAVDDGATYRRLTREQARDALERLGDVQLVVESILGDEWENWGNPRRYRGVPPKPEPCVPASSIYGGSWILNRNAADFVAEHGLSVTEDGAWWFVAPPTISNSRSTDTTPARPAA